MSHTPRERASTAEGKTIKNKDEILQLLKALWLPKRVLIIHCPGHWKKKKERKKVARDNNLVSKAAKKVALKETAASKLTVTLPKPPNRNLPECPAYSEEEIKWATKQPMSLCSEDW